MSYTKVLRWVLLIGLSLVFFIPLIIADGSLWPNMFFPFITGKNFAFRVLIEFLFALYIILALREPKYRPRASYLLWALGVFVVWMGVATITSVDPIKSFWSNFERMEGYLTLLHLFAYFLMVGAVVAAEEWWEQLMQAAIAAGALQALYSLGQLLHVGGMHPSSQSGARLDGTFGNAAYLAVFMLFSVFVTLFMLLRSRRVVWAQSLLGIALVLELATLYYTETRGALLGFVGGLIIAAIIIAWRATSAEWRGLRRVSLWGLGAVAVVVVLFFAARNTSLIRNSSTLNRIASISLTDPTTIARFQIWRMAGEGFKDRPITGWGQENFNFVFNKYYNPAMYDQEQWFDRAHNQFLDWLIAGGLPAFVLYVALFVLVALALWSAEALSAPEQAILLGLLVGYAFNNLFVFDDLMSSVYFFTILALAHSLSRRPTHGAMVLTRPLSDRGIAIAAPIVAVVFVLGVWSLNAPGIARAQNLLTALVTQVPVDNGGVTVAAPKDPKQNLAEFRVALGPNVWPGTPMGRQEATEQLLQFASSEASQSSVDPSVKQDTYTFAEQAGAAINQERPHDARLELFMGVFYEAYGQSAKAVDWLKKALADSPQKQQIMFELGIAQLNANDAADAVATFKQAFNEAPDFKDARIYYASALYYAGDKSDADQLLLSGPAREGFGTVLVDDPRLLQVYANTKQFDRAIAIWKNRVAANPGDTQTHIGLATAYFTSGDTTDAVSELQEAAKQDPSLAPQINAIVKQIQSGQLKPGQ